MSLNRVVDVLHGDRELSGWQVRQMENRSHQLFLNIERSESERRADSLLYEIEILVNRYIAGDGKKRLVTGNAKFSLDVAALDRLPEELKRAHAAAVLVENEPYSIAGVSGQIPDVPLLDSVLEKEPEIALSMAADQARQASAGEDKVRFSAGEFFADRMRVQYFNSHGVEVFQEETLFSGELVMLAAGKSGETEVFRPFKRRRIQDVDIKGLVARMAEDGRARSMATLPQTGSFDVVFSGEALDQFFGWFTAQAGGWAKYNRISRFELGMPIASPASGASPLTLWHNALMPWGVGSYRVDPSGSGGCRRLLIENGELKGRWAISRFAQYLQQEATGELGNIEVEPGNYPEAHLLNPDGRRPLYHLFDFSYFDPNPVTGEFSAEIRAGEELTASGCKPIKGGSVSGSSATACAAARFSKETEQRERYFGPKAIRCFGMTLAGR